MRLLVSCLALALGAAEARAEAVSPRALTEAVGFLALSPGAASTTTVLTYRRHGAGFTPLGALDLSDARWAGGRFLVLARDGDFARIVTHPSSGGAVWVDLEGLRRSSWTAGLALLDDLSGTEERADIFALYPGAARPVCQAPGVMEACPVFGKDDLGPLRILAQRGDYVLLGRETAPLGWTALHDEGGRLNVWLTR